MYLEGAYRILSLVKQRAIINDHYHTSADAILRERAKDLV